MITPLLISTAIGSGRVPWHDMLHLSSLHVLHGPCWPALCAGAAWRLQLGGAAGAARYCSRVLCALSDIADEVGHTALEVVEDLLNLFRVDARWKSCEWADRRSHHGRPCRFDRRQTLYSHRRHLRRAGCACAGDAVVAARRHSFRAHRLADVAHNRHVRLHLWLWLRL